MTTFPQALIPLPHVTIIQAEHLDMRFLIDCIDDSAIMDVGPARRLIPWCSALGTDQG
jgi:hypothetical protein